MFGIPGAQIYGLFDALQKASGTIRTYGARHERGCAYDGLRLRQGDRQARGLLGGAGAGHPRTRARAC